MKHIDNLEPGERTPVEDLAVNLARRLFPAGYKRDHAISIIQEEVNEMLEGIEGYVAHLMGKK